MMIFHFKDGLNLNLRSLKGCHENERETGKQTNPIPRNHIIDTNDKEAVNNKES